MNKNEQIVLSYSEAITILKEVNVMLISLHKMGSFYMDTESQNYEKETTRFVDEWKVTQRLACIREILSNKFDLGLGDDDMDDLEREMEAVRYWCKPGDSDA